MRYTVVIAHHHFHERVSIPEQTGKGVSAMFLFDLLAGVF